MNGKIVSPGNLKIMKMTRQMYSIVRSRWFLPAVAVFAVLLRLSLVFVTHHPNTAAFADEIDYMNIGKSLATGNGFIKDGVHYTAYRPPAQPFVIALLFRALGPHTLAVMLLLAATPVSVLAGFLD